MLQLPSFAYVSWLDVRLSLLADCWDEPNSECGRNDTRGYQHPTCIAMQPWGPVELLPPLMLAPTSEGTLFTIHLPSVLRFITLGRFCGISPGVEKTIPRCMTRNNEVKIRTNRIKYTEKKLPKAAYQETLNKHKREEVHYLQAFFFQCLLAWPSETLHSRQSQYTHRLTDLLMI